MAANKAPMRGSLKTAQSGAEYEVLKTSLINGRIVNAGEIVQYDGIPGKFLKPLNGAAESVKKEADAIKADRQDSIIKTETLSGAQAADRKLKELSDKRLGVGIDAEPRDNGPEPSAADKKAFEAAAEQTRNDTIEAAHEAGGVMLQMTGVSPEMVVPTTGPGAAATAQQQKTADEKKKGR